MGYNPKMGEKDKHIPRVDATQAKAAFVAMNYCAANCCRTPPFNQIESDLHGDQFVGIMHRLGRAPRVDQRLPVSSLGPGDGAPISKLPYVLAIHRRQSKAV